MAHPGPIAVDDAGRRHAVSEAFLQALGDRVRQARARHGMTRRDLATHSGVSERHLAQLEAGKGNISVGLLRNVALALATPVGDLLREGPEPSAEARLLQGVIDRLTPEQAVVARKLLDQRFNRRPGRNVRLALIGLRGAGKTTVGRLVAEARGIRFVELARAVEQTAGMPLQTIFDLAGQAGYRRYEQKTLQTLLDDDSPLVLATAGGIVSDSRTFHQLLSGCFTVWLQAEPQQHMQRVIAQGDNRPMAGNRQAMQDLKRILASRESLYAQADASVDTSNLDAAGVAARVLDLWPDARRQREANL
ncbi:MAG: helix-turn-helix transcriptional regulator [Pseudomonadota bacterium]|nr:helix-turn-helix transcriptional regulator [Pseudomonadota bacterium]